MQFCNTSVLKIVVFHFSFRFSLLRMRSIATTVTTDFMIVCTGENHGYCVPLHSN